MSKSGKKPTTANPTIRLIGLGETGVKLVETLAMIAPEGVVAHSLDTARARGYRAMQYNFVVATNARAIDTWQRAGFGIVGRLPGAFLHPRSGYVDALVMFKDLTDGTD